MTWASMMQRKSKISPASSMRQADHDRPLEAVVLHQALLFQHGDRLAHRNPAGVEQARDLILAQGSRRLSGSPSMMARRSASNTSPPAETVLDISTPFNAMPAPTRTSSPYPISAGSGRSLILYIGSNPV
jgi:hypothetical protein